MSKPYFAKYLPVDGKVNMGNKFIDTEVMNMVGTRTSEECEYDFQKIKLFLCSRDIQVGDKILGTILTNDNVYILSDSELGFDINENRHGISLEEAQIMGGYKVIGEISPNADWVKEGDEFNEDEVSIVWKCPHYNGRHWNTDCNCKSGLVEVALIRNPKSKHWK